MHGVKCGLQILTSSFVLTLKLLDVPIELPLHSADLLLEQIGTVLQIATDVTQLMIPPTFNPRRSNDLAGEQFRLISSESSIAKRRDFSATQLGGGCPTDAFPCGSVADVLIAMSALGHQRTLASELGVSALPLKADMLSVTKDVRSVP